MKLLIRNYPALTIPDELLVPMEKPFNEHTPYVSKVAARWKSKGYQRKLSLKVLCLESLRERMEELGSYDTYSDPMAGIGISARIFGKNCTVKLNDLDEGCRKVLAANFKGLIEADDILKRNLRKADLIFLDFNDLALKRAMGKYSTVIHKASYSARKFLVINDCSPFYLRMGKKPLEVYSNILRRKLNSVEDYFRALDPYYADMGLYLSRVAYFSETSFLLFSKQPVRTYKLINMAKEPVPLGMISVQTDESIAA